MCAYQDPAAAEVLQPSAVVQIKARRFVILRLSVLKETRPISVSLERLRRYSLRARNLELPLRQLLAQEYLRIHLLPTSWALDSRTFPISLPNTVSIGYSSRPIMCTSNSSLYFILSEAAASEPIKLEPRIAMPSLIDLAFSLIFS